MYFYLFKIILLLTISEIVIINCNSDQCSINNRAECAGAGSEKDTSKSEKYTKYSNAIYRKTQRALKNYESCSVEEDDSSCDCHAAVIDKDLQYYLKDGITRKMIEDSAKFGTRYKILNHHLYRDEKCMFPARCSGIEHFLLTLLPKLANMDLVINTRDWPQLPAAQGNKKVILSFSKTNEYRDIMYPAWTFWEGGPAISLYPTGIGRWDLLRERLKVAATKMPWSQKLAQGFFRGSRTSDERDALVLLSRRLPDLVDAQYTKNQAWKSPKDTLNAEPAKEVTFEEHCKYKYLFNFRGVAASFRLKHLFLCKSLVFHVGDEWNEFFYFAMKPWVHYVPLSSYPTEEQLEEILLFFQEHDDLAQQIAERGYEFIWKHLRVQDVECYWKKLLKSYQKLLKYKVVENKELVEIKLNKK